MFVDNYQPAVNDNHQATLLSEIPANNTYHNPFER
jgi:hypothetical protein